MTKPNTPENKWKVAIPSKPTMQPGDEPVMVINDSNSSTTVAWNVIDIQGQKNRTNTLFVTVVPGSSTIPLRVLEGIREQATTKDGGVRGYLRQIRVVDATFDKTGKVPQTHNMNLVEAEAVIENTTDLTLLDLFLEMENTQRPDGPRKGLVTLVERQKKAVELVDSKIEKMAEQTTGGNG